jgi:hypothetical protein
LIDAYVEGDKPPSQKTLQKVKACKQFVEEYYWELLAYIHARNKRHEKLIAKLAESKESSIMKENLCREHINKETTLLRSRRLCGRLSDFILLKRIGKGAYGEVRILLCLKNYMLNFEGVSVQKEANQRTLCFKEVIKSQSTYQESGILLCKYNLTITY